MNLRYELELTVYRELEDGDIDKCPISDEAAEEVEATLNEIGTVDLIDDFESYTYFTGEFNTLDLSSLEWITEEGYDMNLTIHFIA